MTGTVDNTTSELDSVVADIVDYIVDFRIDSELAFETARYCLLDTIGCGLLALDYPQCTKLLGPIVPEASVSKGARVPGTAYELDPVQAAFNIGCMIRWLDFNDTWLAAEWGHPSDNLGGILAVADYLNRARGAALTVRDLLTAMIKAHEIQGVLALGNSFNRVGLDHVLLVRVATAAVVTGMLGGTRAQIANAVSNAWADGGALRVYRQAPNTGSRKSWAAGDATSRGVRLAFMAMANEMGYPSVLTTATWGFQDALFRSTPVTLAQPLDSYVIENILFKISFPAEFHAQTAVECAVQLHEKIRDRLHDVRCIRIRTHESAIRIISKTGPLHNPADRDHCLQYMVAVGLIFGQLTAAHYEDDTAADTRIDALRELMTVGEDEHYSRDYLDPLKRSIANALRIEFQDGSHTDWIAVEYPIGHRRRRSDGLPLLMKKFEAAVHDRFDAARTRITLDRCTDAPMLLATDVSEFVSLFAM